MLQIISADFHILFVDVDYHLAGRQHYLEHLRVSHLPLILTFRPLYSTTNRSPLNRLNQLTEHLSDAERQSFYLFKLQCVNFSRAGRNSVILHRQVAQNIYLSFAFVFAA